MTSPADQRYITDVATTFGHGGFTPAALGLAEIRPPAWFEWVPGQRCLNSAAWSDGVRVVWQPQCGWHYVNRAQPSQRHPLPLTRTADPMEVADTIRRLLLGLTADLPASETEWIDDLGVGA